jgi:hypothetical protein
VHALVGVDEAGGGVDIVLADHDAIADQRVVSEAACGGQDVSEQLEINNCARFKVFSSSYLSLTMTPEHR